jgi:hypothetical protein
MTATAVVERQDHAPANVEQHPASDSAALIAVISRAASDPNVDIDKMERLMAMHERMQARAARVQYDEAFAAMQPNLPEIDKRGKIIIRDKNDAEKIIQSTPYALWEDTNKVIKPILAEYGFALSFRITQTEAKITTTAVLSHSGGHREETSFAASIDNTGSKNNVQGWGSSFSYGKRYSGTAILNITTKGEDDDGKATGSIIGSISDEQRVELEGMLKDAKVPVKDFCDYAKIETLADLPAAKFDVAKQRIQNRKAGAK